MVDLVGIYTRVSTQEQTEGYSIGEQEERARRFCEAMNWTVYEVYTDPGFSGGNTDRPALQKMIRDIKSGRISRVIVYKLDRLSRSQKDTLILIEDVFLANGVDFVSMTENLDTSTAFGRAIIGILAAFAQLERENIKERMNLGINARRRSGRWHGSGLPPIGYDYTDGELRINEFEAMQIREAFELSASGIRPNTITKTFNEKGYSTKYGEWSSGALRQILRNILYTGKLKLKDEIIEGIHEPIISEDLFNRVQTFLDQCSESHEKNRMRSGKATTYLGGFIVCGRCGAKYSKRISRNRKGYRYELFACNSRTKANPYVVKDPECKNKTWRLEELTELVFNEIRGLALDPDRIEKVEPPEDHSELIREEIKKLENQSSRLLDLYTVGDFPLDVLKEKVREVNEKKEKLETELLRIEKERKKRTDKDAARAVISSFSDILDTGDFDEIRAAIGALIDKIVIDGEDVTIHWKFI